MPESGRGGGGRQHIPTLIEAAKRGLGIFPSFPMGSGFNQEFDNIYEKFKKEIYAKADAIETRRKLEGEDSTLTRKDLGELINGKPGDSIEEKPFDSAFSKESITSSFAKIGACPLTRNSLFNNPKLRRGADANSTDHLLAARRPRRISTRPHSLSVKRSVCARARSLSCQRRRRRSGRHF